MPDREERRAQVLNRLIDFAGDEDLFIDALRDLNASGTPPTLDALLRRIVEIRAAEDAEWEALFERKADSVRAHFAVMDESLRVAGKRIGRYVQDDEE